MATPLSMLKGTAAEVAAKIYGNALLVWNETTKRWHGGDGVTAGGIPMARYDERNNGALGYVQEIKANDYAVVVADSGKALVFNKGSAVVATLGAAATLTSAFVVLFRNVGAGALSIAPTGAELIDGVNAAINVPTGASLILKGDGTAFRTFLSNVDVTGNAISNAAALTGANLADGDKVGVYDVSAGALVSVLVSEFIAGIFKVSRKIANAYFLSSIRLWDATDPTKGLGWTLSAIATATTRMITMPDRDVDLGRVPTPWVVYTPTLTGNTAASSRCRSRRVGSNLEVEFAITFNGGGSAGTDLALELGFNGTSGGLSIDTYWNSARIVVGHAGWDVQGAVDLAILAIGGASVINIGAGATGRAHLVPGKGDFVNGSQVAGKFSVPIQGWN